MLTNCAWQTPLLPMLQKPVLPWRKLKANPCRSSPNFSRRKFATDSVAVLRRQRASGSECGVGRGRRGHQVSKLGRRQNIRETPILHFSTTLRLLMVKSFLAAEDEQLDFEIALGR